MSGAEPSAKVEYTLASVPPLGGMPVTLLVGLDENGPEGSLKVYLGARYKRVHILVDDEAAKDQFRRAWRGGQHVWMWPIPPSEDLYVDPAAVDATPAGDSS